MSFLGVTPDAVTSAAGHLGAIGSALSSANATAAGPTTGAAAMAADEVSAAVQALFATHAQAYQSVSAQMEAYHSQFVNLLNGGAASYLNTEIANAQQTLSVGTLAALGAGGTPAATTTAIDLLNLAPLLTISESFPPTGSPFITFNLFGSSFSEPLPPGLARDLLHLF
jgi:hypothetical protein